MGKGKLFLRSLIILALVGVVSFLSSATSGDKAIVGYDPKEFYGEPVYSADGKLQYVAENKSQTHLESDYVMVRVKGIKTRLGSKEIGRIRIAVWKSSDTYAKEGVKPFRACSHWAKDVTNNEMVFKISLPKDNSYSFFAHFDKNNSGRVRRVLGIPIEPFIFSNAKNQGQGPGLTREGLSPPKFQNTLVKMVSSGQEIVLNF